MYNAIYFLYDVAVITVTI